MKVIRKKLQTVAQEFGDKDSWQEEDVVAVVEELQQALLKFIKKYGDDPKAVRQAYIDYQCALAHPAVQQGLEQYSLAPDNQDILAKLPGWPGESVELINVRLATDILISQMRQLGQGFFSQVVQRQQYEQVGDVESAVIHVHNQLLTLFLDYLELCRESGLSFEDELVWEVEQAYRSLLYFCHLFGIDDALASYDLVVNTDAIKEELAETDEYAYLLGKLNRLDEEGQSWDWHSVDQVGAMMAQVAQDFEENRRERSWGFFVAESRARLLELAGGHIQDQLKRGQVNSGVIIFGSLVYLCDAYQVKSQWQRFFPQEPLLEPAYEAFAPLFQHQPEFRAYLQWLEQGEWTQAIASYPQYELPYYFGLLDQLGQIRSNEQLLALPAEELQKLMDNISKLGYLYEILVFNQTCQYLPTPFDYGSQPSIVEEDFELFTQLLQLLMKLIDMQRDVQRKNVQLQQLVDKNNKMVDDFSHVWVNTIKPDMVYNVAQALWKKTGFEKEYAELMRAYNDEVMLKNQCELLRLTHTDNSIKSKLELQEYVRRGVDNLKPSKNSRGVIYLVNYALERVLTRVFFEESGRVEKIRADFANRGFDLAGQVRQDFQQQVLANREEQLAVEWFNQLGAMPLKLSYDAQWDRLLLDKNGGAATFLISRLMELFFNAFTYGEKGADSYLELELTSEERGLFDYLVIRVTNPVQAQNKYTGGNGKGLAATQEILQMLNYDLLEGDPDFLPIRIFDGDPAIYGAALYIRGGLLIEEE